MFTLISLSFATRSKELGFVSKSHLYSTWVVLTRTMWVELCTVLFFVAYCLSKCESDLEGWAMLYTSALWEGVYGLGRIQGHKVKGEQYGSGHHPSDQITTRYSLTTYPICLSWEFALPFGLKANLIMFKADKGSKWPFMLIYPELDIPSCNFFSLIWVNQSPTGLVFLLSPGNFIFWH